MSRETPSSTDFREKLQEILMTTGFFPAQRSVSMMACVRNKCLEGQINGTPWSKELCAVVR
jgi:hypothetical protein